MTKEDKRKRVTGRTLNAEPTGDVFPNEAPRDAVQLEFARRLNRAMIERGINSQAELAREASKHMVDGEIQRDTISKYVNAMTLPSPVRLAALAKALGKEPSDLVPARGISKGNVKMPAFEMQQVGEGYVWLRINQQVTMAQALEIMRILGEGNKQ